MYDSRPVSDLLENQLAIMKALRFLLLDREGRREDKQPPIYALEDRISHTRDFLSGRP
jgi:hypothetical protein